MLGLIAFISVISAAGALVLFFNKGEQAQKIKTVLMKILDNFKDLFKNLKDLFILIKEIFSNETDEINPTVGKEAVIEDAKDDQPESTPPDSVIDIASEQTIQGDSNDQPESTPPDSVIDIASEQTNKKD